MDNKIADHKEVEIMIKSLKFTKQFLKENGIKEHSEQGQLMIKFRDELIKSVIL
ncbi:hypothetical protein [Lactococcus allomyrinae]|uniref:hypothetical protein n=1 Tax=Lactococcus allomyrinae TaxID=2419773 RepID=UPI0013C52FA4|nr:hypothetical protein [Lactococcus allomyrinae]